MTSSAQRWAVSIVSSRNGVCAFFTSVPLGDNSELTAAARRLDERMGRAWKCRVDTVRGAISNFRSRALEVNPEGWKDQVASMDEAALTRWHSAGGRRPTGTNMTAAEIVAAVDAFERPKR